MKRRVLIALLAGAATGAVVAQLLRIAISRTATPLSPERALWQFLLLVLAGALSGFAISAVTALRAASPEADYHDGRRTLRPSGRRQPPGDGH